MSKYSKEFKLKAVETYLSQHMSQQEVATSFNIPRSHAHLPIGEVERDAWLLCMERAIAKQHFAPEFSTYLLAQLRIPAERIFANSSKHGV